MSEDTKVIGTETETKTKTSTEESTTVQNPDGTATTESKIDTVEEVVAEVEKLGSNITQKLNKGFNQYHFSILILLIAIGITSLVIFNGYASSANLVATIAAQINGIALFFISFFGCCLVLMGFKVSVYTELVDEHNIALAIFLLGIAYGIASIIAKAAL